MDNIFFPVRCFTCGKLIGQYQETYEQMINNGYTPAQAMDTLGINRECCRGNVLNPIQLAPNIQLNITEEDMFLAPEVVSTPPVASPSTLDTPEPMFQEATNADRWYDPEEFSADIDDYLLYEAR